MAAEPLQATLCDLHESVLLVTIAFSMYLCIWVQSMCYCRGVFFICCSFTAQKAFLCRISCDSCCHQRHDKDTCVCTHACTHAHALDRCMCTLARNLRGDGQEDVNWIAVACLLYFQSCGICCVVGWAAYSIGKDCSTFSFSNKQLKVLQSLILLGTARSTDPRRLNLDHQFNLHLNGV